MLKKNVEINGYQNVALVRKAISSQTGTAQLYLCESNPGMHRMYSAHASGKSIEIEMIRLDDYFANYRRRVDFIKMDIGGAELYALQGMLRLLRKDPQIKIMTEFVPAHLQGAGAEPEAYLQLLLESGFKLLNLNSKQQTVEPANLGELLREQTHTNLLCVKA